MIFTSQQFVQFVTTKHRRLAHIKRYNTTPLSIQESVAEHSYFVAVYGMLLCDYVSTRISSHDKLPDKLKVIQRGLLHDIEEVISGDIMGLFKQKHQELKPVLDKINETSVDEVVQSLPSSIGDEMKDLWKNAKEDTLEGKIIRVADRISLIVYCLEQINTGNKYMEPILQRAFDYLDNMNESWIDELVLEFKIIKSNVIE